MKFIARYFRIRMIAFDAQCNIFISERSDVRQRYWVNLSVLQYTLRPIKTKFVSKALVVIN